MLNNFTGFVLRFPQQAPTPEERCKYLSPDGITQNNRYPETGIAMKCHYCGSTKLRVSRLRGGDIVRLLLFQYPIRCRACRERDYAGLMLALGLRQAEKARHAEERAAGRSGSNAEAR